MLSILGIGTIMLAWALRDIKKPPKEEIESLKVGDMIVVKVAPKTYTHGRIALIEREQGWGVIKEANPPHAAHEFKAKDVRQKI